MKRNMNLSEGKGEEAQQGERDQKHTTETNHGTLALFLA